MVQGRALIQSLRKPAEKLSLISVDLYQVYDKSTGRAWPKWIAFLYYNTTIFRPVLAPFAFGDYVFL